MKKKTNKYWKSKKNLKFNIANMINFQMEIEIK